LAVGNAERSPSLPHRYGEKRGAKYSHVRNTAERNACTSTEVEPSHVFTAMYDEQPTQGSVRISLDRANEDEQID